MHIYYDHNKKSSRLLTTSTTAVYNDFQFNSKICQVAVLSINLITLVSDVYFYRHLAVDWLSCTSTLTTSNQCDLISLKHFSQ